MRNYLYITALSFMVVSCGSQKKVVQSPAKPVTTQNTADKDDKDKDEEKPKVQRERGEDYFRINIADASKNDNTISYSSIASAKPDGYKVVKTYFPAVAQNFRQRYVILHYTALDNDKSVMVLTQQSVSAHYLVNDLDDKEIYQLVDENKRAYHAGVSQWRNDSQLNDTSIGIEIVNIARDSAGVRIFPPYPEAQFRKIGALVKDIVERYDIPPTNILAHSDIAPARKQDPGPQFPWKRLYDEYGVGMWYDEAVQQSFYNQALAQDFTLQMEQPSFIYTLQSDFKKFGYGVIPSGTLDNTTKKTIEAFQYHFRPSKYEGVMDAETWSILQALIQKYPVK
ncbi:MAG: N-acetylmuramoyl-L-alanine amidase [Bergeyella sp.]